MPTFSNQVDSFQSGYMYVGEGTYVYIEHRVDALFARDELTGRPYTPVATSLAPIMTPTDTTVDLF